jgi:ketosteroid isomerase-like protein
MMTTKLRELLAAYFAAMNRQDVNAMLEAFASDAVVKDEGETRRGRAAVRAWIEDTTRKYSPSFEVGEVLDEGASTVVLGDVSGAFPGSPIRLRYAFTLDSARISRLEIT